MKRLTKTGKILVGILIAGALFGLGYLIFPKNGNVFSKFGGSSPDLTIGLNTWIGFSPIVWYNGGNKVNKESRVTKNFGLKLQINQMDVRQTCIETLLADKIDAIYTTTDISGAEMGAEGELVKAGVVQFFKVDDSRGADVIVGTSAFKSVADLKSTTRIACAFPTASSTLLINWLDAGGKTIKDVDVIPVESAGKATELFESGGCDIAVVWSPDDGDCLAKVKGSHVLTSTKFATSIIMDGMVAKKSVVDKKMKDFIKLAKAWMSANADMQESSNRDSAALYFSKYFGFDIALCKDGVEKVRFATYGDNKAFFGLDPNYTGVTGYDLYDRMSRIYSKTESKSGGFYAKNPIPWIKASYSGVIENITDMNGGNNVAEGEVKFIPSTKEEMSKPSIATKQVTINFATNQFNLDNDAKTVIDREISPIAKGWRGARIRIEGNTDNTGNYKNNKTLSYKRAQSVADYLVKTYGFDINKFQIIGNGPDKPASGGSVKAGNATEDMKTANRRTDFGLIAE